MPYPRTLSAVSFGDTKAAALYFDRILPVEFKVLRGTGAGVICEMPDPMDVEVVVKLIFGDDAPRHLIISYLDDYWSPFMKQLHPFIKVHRRSSDPVAYSELKELYLGNAQSDSSGSVRGAFGAFARSLGVDSYSVLLPDAPTQSSYSEAYACLVADNLSLVDTSKASWDQIMELRADPEARAKLRRLRLLFEDKYVGKARAYIEDDLQRRLDDYEMARRKHGLDVTLSSLSVLLDAKSIQAAAVAGFTTALFGGPMAGIAAGAAIEIGKVVVEVTKKVAEIRQLADGHDLGYVLHAQRVV